MILVLIGVGVIAVLVWVGRKPARVRGGARLTGALTAAVAAAAAVACGLRGQWMGAIALIALSAWLGHFARTGAAAAGPVSPKAQAMSAAEACSILGVGPQADRAEIEAAYRRLMQRAHPDHGGSTGLAAQLNAARDRLLK
jgi:hypothetical protein